MGENCPSCLEELLKKPDVQTLLRPIAELSDLLDDTLEQELLSDIPDFTGSFPADQLRQVTGKGKDTGKTFYRIQPYLPDGRRITLRLGSGQKQAAKAFKAIRDLIDSKKARQQIWSNFFNSLRASAETDLMDEFGLRRACQWAGNSPATAMKNYALVRKTDFVDDGNSVTKSDAKSDAEWASLVEQKPNKKRTVKNSESSQCVSVDDIGLEPTTSSMSTRRSSQLS